MLRRLFQYSAQTTMTAIIALLIGVVSFVVFDLTIGAVSCLLGWAMLAITISDAKRFIIPDTVCLPMIPVGLLSVKLSMEPLIADQALLDHFSATIVAAAALFAVRYFYQTYRGVEGLGLGDVKLAAAAGAWTGLDGVGPVMLAACAGAISYVGLIAWQRRPNVTPTMAIPFGAFLAPSIWIVWAFSQL